MAFRWMAFPLALLIAGIPATGQTPTGSVEGRVICSDGNVPARFASVFLEPLTNLLSPDNGGKKPSNFTRQSETDFTGRYFYPSISVGTYVVHIEKAGYSDDFELVKKVLDRFTPDEKKQILSNFPQVTVTASGMASKDVVISRGGAINGHISIDTGGLPGQAEVTATMVSSDLLGALQDIGGKKPLHFAKTGHIDDRGVYRIAGLPAGTYRIQVMLVERFLFDNGSESSPRPTRAGTGSVMVFAPDALKQRDAKLVKVGEGDELSDIDITLPLSRLHSVSGTIKQDGVPVAGAFVRIAQQGQKHDNADIMSFEDDYQDACELTGMMCADGANDATSIPDGSYRFDLLPPGTYTIKAQRYSFGEGRIDGRPLGPSAKITIQVSDRDVFDANIEIPEKANDLPAQVSGK